MPIIKRFSNCVIQMFADEHPPPHFHVAFSDGIRCSVEIETLAVSYGTPVPVRRLREPLSWAAGNREVLRAKWKELTE